MEHSARSVHPRMQGRARIGSQYMKRGSLDSVLDCPLDGAVKDRLVVVIHSKYKRSVDHYAEIVKTSYCARIVSIQVLRLSVLAQVGWAQRFESNEETAKPASHG